MRLTRLIAGTVTAGLLSLVPIALTAPAAQASVTTNLQVQSSYKMLTYGMETSLRAAVTATDSTGYTGAVRVGSVQLQSKVTGKAWKTIKTATASSYVSFGQIKPKEHTEYRISYSGGTDTYGNVFRAGVSTPVKVKVKRKITFPRKGLTLKGKVSPQFKKKKLVVKVSKKETKGFKKYRTIKTNKKGRYSLKLPRRRGTFFYKVIVPKDKRFLSSSYTWRTYGY
ncbi:hypothetical protein [Nocardioides gilvus]|uniref:hypothetical protein n=1 Tax=Nocardioides gilvus TaxID=1735589 RepID=UPI000D740D49|nr:hypothetical protein [Nocardioides gilvus]